MTQKCRTCWLYTSRLGLAQEIGEVFHSEGRWDYDTCNKACIVKSEADRVRYEKEKIHLRDKYRREHPGVIPGHRRVFARAVC